MKLTQIPTPQTVLDEHRVAGGEVLERFVADLPDGMLRLMYSVEPNGKGGMVTLISISIGSPLGSPGTIRRPTKVECLAAISDLTARNLMSSLRPIPRLIEIDDSPINDSNVVLYEG